MAEISVQQNELIYFLPCFVSMYKTGNIKNEKSCTEKFKLKTKTMFLFETGLVENIKVSYTYNFVCNKWLSFEFSMRANLISLKTDGMNATYN
jgi:hypothetical protein